MSLSEIRRGRIRSSLFSIMAMSGVVGFSLLGLSGPAFAQDGDITLPEVQVIGVAPLHGTGVDKDKVPANVKVTTGRELQETGALNIGSGLYREFGSVTVNDSQNNPFQRDVYVRGYTASPLLGNSQGLAVYLNGARINEGFGEEVQWDLVPEFAVDQIQLIPGANPVYGLNALGGSLSVQMKNGFDNEGLSLLFSGGSFGRFTETMEYGLSVDEYAAYVGISRHDENGWRDFSPSELTRIFTDLSYRGDRMTASVSANLASTDLNGNGLSPFGLLQQNREAVFTHPDNTRNRMAHIVTNVAYDLNDSTLLEGMAYYRLLERKTLNGDEFESEVCEELAEDIAGDSDGNLDEDDILNAVRGQFSGFQNDFLCGEIEEDDIEELAEVDAVDEENPTPDEINAAITEAAQAIANQVLLKKDESTESGFSGIVAESDETDDEEEANGAFNTSTTVTNSVGGSLQASVDRPLFGMENLLIAGTSVDHSATNYGNDTEIGLLNSTRGVDRFSKPIFLATNYGLTEAGRRAKDGARGDEKTLYSYTAKIKGSTTSVGAYFSDNLEITNALSATVSGRFNWTEVGLEDLLVGTKETHTYNRFNPAAGLTYQFGPRLGVFANYSEANRAPSPVELSCADPENPCRVPNAFVADPPLEQVVNRSVEIGARGDGFYRDLTYGWSVAGFAGRNYNDIIFVRAPPEQPVGLGYFQNAGTTQRMGAELDFRTRWKQLALSASYAYIDATFRSVVQFPEQELEAPTLGIDDKDLENVTERGDRIPGIPKHNLRLGLDYHVTDEWVIGLEGIYASNQVLRGDEGNEAPKVDGYGLMNLRTAYAFNDQVEAFLYVDNVFDTKYETFGIVGEEPSEVLGDDFEDNRFLGPGAPRGIWGGFRIGF